MLWITNHGYRGRSRKWARRRSKNALRWVNGVMFESNKDVSKEVPWIKLVWNK